MALGLGMPRGFFSELLRRRHTSYLRMNWFPPCTEHSDPPPLGISPHRSAPDSNRSCLEPRQS
eukprot:6206444-Pleurochrysis_carterae.AAC.1